jgi:hypothetical protein
MVSFPVVQSKLSSGAGFSQGETLVFKAVRSLGGSLWQVSHKGRRFVIRSELALKVGARYHTRVHRVGTTATLRLTPDLPGRSETPTGILIAPGSNENTLARTLFHAMQSVGLKLSGALLTKAQAVFGRLKKKDSTGATLIAMLMDKGLEPDAGYVDVLVDCLDRRSSGHGRQGPKKDGFHRRITVAAIKDQLHLQLKKLGENANLLSLFNHIAAVRNNWVVIPYQVSQNGDTISGTVRLRTGKARGIDRVVLETTGEEGLTDFSMGWPPGPKATLTVRSEDQHLLMAFSRDRVELEEKLRNLNLIIDDNKREKIDRFTQEELAPLRGVNELV